MDKEAIINSINFDHSSFVEFIEALNNEEYVRNRDQKWSAERQMEHLILCVRPLVQVFSKEPIAIEKAFGRTDRRSSTYDDLLDLYRQRLKEGGKAPDRYVPGEALNGTKAEKCQEMLALVSSLCLRIEYLSDDDLDSLQIPHPLLGNLTLREMLYNMIYHVKHHHDQSIENLRERT